MFIHSSLLVIHNSCCPFLFQEPNFCFTPLTNHSVYSLICEYIERRFAMLSFPFNENDLDGAWTCSFSQPTSCWGTTVPLEFFVWIVCWQWLHLPSFLTIFALGNFAWEDSIVPSYSWRYCLGSHLNGFVVRLAARLRLRLRRVWYWSRYFPLSSLDWAKLQIHVVDVLPSGRVQSRNTFFECNLIYPLFRMRVLVILDFWQLGAILLRYCHLQLIGLDRLVLDCDKVWLCCY